MHYTITALTAIFLSISILYGEENQESLKLKGGLRYRHEVFLEENRNSRNRHRIQAKIGVEANINSRVATGLELASGGGTARSANQSLDDGFSKKGLFINQANFVWSPGFLPGASLKGGKFKNPFRKVSKAELVWDSDNVPEGIALQYENDFSSISPFFTAAGLWVQESGGADGDVFLYAVQGGAKIPLGNLYLTGGLGYYVYTDIQGHGSFNDGKDSSFFGNSTVTDGTGNQVYVNDYAPVDFMLELGTASGSFPAAVFGHYVVNPEADRENTGWLAGVSIGKVKKPGSFALRAYYRVMEKDAVFDVFADSDFGGGGTGNSGMEMNAGLGIAKNISAKVSWFINEKDLGDDINYQRGQFDVKYKF